MREEGPLIGKKKNKKKTTLLGFGLLGTTTLGASPGGDDHR